MELSPVHVSFVVACSALVAATIAPAVSLVVSRRQFNASVLSANREKWIARLRQDDPAVCLESADVERIAAAAQAVLGAEWRRVKRGD